MRAWLSLLLLVLLACSQASQPPPGPKITTGDKLEYRFTEVNQKQHKTREGALVLTFRSNESGYTLEGGASPVQLTSNLAPADGAPLSDPDVGLVYLPPGLRSPKTTTVAGQVDYKKTWEGREVWVVQVRQGITSGQRYYDARTGFLYGWELTREDTDRVPYYTKAVLIKSDLL